jgi:hypothetical protein
MAEAQQQTIPTFKLVLGTTSRTAHSQGLQRNHKLIDALLFCPLLFFDKRPDRYLDVARYRLCHICTVSLLAAVYDML